MFSVVSLGIRLRLRLRLDLRLSRANMENYKGTMNGCELQAWEPVCAECFPVQPVTQLHTKYSFAR